MSHAELAGAQREAQPDHEVGDGERSDEDRSNGRGGRRPVPGEPVRGEEPEEGGQAADVSPTTTELRSASIMRSFASSDSYQRSEGPSNGGTGTSPSWNENSISVTGRKMNA